MLMRIKRTPEEQAGVSGAGLGGLIGGLFLGAALWPTLLAPRPVPGGVLILLAVAAYLFTRVAHELAHWVVHRSHGRRARMSIGWPAYCWTAESMSRNQALLVLVTPFAAITALSLAALAWDWARTSLGDIFWLFVGAWNALGSIQDLREAGLLLRTPPSAQVVDLRDEMIVEPALEPEDEREGGVEKA